MGGGHSIAGSTMKGWGQSKADASAVKGGNSDANAFQIGENESGELKQSSTCN
jgi:hypothetical protein